MRHWPGQCRGPGDLVGAPFVPEQSLDPADAQRVDARVAVRSLAAGSADPISTLRVVARHIGIAAELAADGARRAVQAVGDRPKRKVGLALVPLLIGVNNQYRGRTLVEYEAQFAGLLERAIAFAGGEAQRSG